VSNPTSGCEVGELLLPYLEANVSTITEDGLNRTGRSCGCSVVSAPSSCILSQGSGHRLPHFAGPAEAEVAPPSV
jgi:hypothetical protein